MRTIATNNNMTGVKVMNIQSIMSKMKVLILAVMAMMALGLASCTNNDDDLPGGGGSKASQVEVQPVAYITDDMLDLFDITYRYNGETVSLTKENTQPCQLKVGELVYDVRKYTGKSGRITSFPGTTEATATVTLKDGVDLSKVEDKIKYTLGINMVAKNNAGYSLNLNTLSISQTKYPLKRMTENQKKRLIFKTISTKLTCADANNGKLNSEKIL